MEDAFRSIMMLYPTVTYWVMVTTLVLGVLATLLHGVHATIAAITVWRTTFGQKKLTPWEP